MAGIDYTSRSVPYNVLRLAGGLNSTGSPLSVDDSESTDCQNVDFDKFGSIIKRNGYATLNSSAFNSGATWNSLHWYEPKSGVDFLIGTCGNKLAKMDDLDGTWDDITGSLTITAGNSNFTNWVTFLDTAIGTNGVNAPFKWTGSGNGAALDVPTGLTIAKYIEVFNGYVFLANVTVSGTARPSRLYWSNLNSITTWTASDNRDISQDDGQEITGIKTLGEKLIVFKERSIWEGIFTGDSDIPFLFFKTPSHVGCVSSGSIQEVSNGLVFLSRDGYYYFDGTNSLKMSDRVTLTLTVTLEPNRFTSSRSIYQTTKNRYYSTHTLAAGTTHNRMMTWDSYNNAWSFYKGHNANCFAIVNTSGQERVYFGDYAGFVYRMDTGANDNPSGSSTAIDAYYYTKWFNFGDLVDKKGTPHCAIYHQIDNSTLTFAYSYDFESTDQNTQTFSMNTSTSVYGTAVYGTGTYAASGGFVTRRNLTGRGRVVRLKFANNVASETFQVDGFGLFPHLETVK